MMSRYFRLSSELSRAIAKRLPHAKNQLSPPGSFFNQFVTEISILTIKTRLMFIYVYTLEPLLSIPPISGHLSQPGSPFDI